MEPKNKKETIQLRFAEQIRIAVSNPRRYSALFSQKFNRHFFYFLILLLLVTVIRYVIPTAAYLHNEGGLRVFCTESLPQFSFANGGLSVSSKYMLNFSSVGVVVDTSVDAFTQEDAIRFLENEETLEGVSAVFVVSKTNIATSQVADVFSISALSLDGYDNQALYRDAPLLLFLGGLDVFFGQLILYIFSGLFFAAYGFFLSRVFRIKVSFAHIYVIALYAKTLQVLIESALQVAGGTGLIYTIGSLIGVFLTCNYVAIGTLSFGPFRVRK